MTTEMNTRPRKRFLQPGRVWILLVFIFLSALLVRLYHITEPLMDFHPARQYYSATIARWFYYENNPEIPNQIKQIAKDSCPPSIEPPVMEVLAATGYKMIGKDALWLPRIYSISFWMVGGAFLFLTVRRILDPSIALLSLLYYFFLPFTILASRSFQPEPLMVMLVIAGIYWMTRYFHAPSISNLVICGVVCACAALEKPNSAFVILGAFTGLGLNQWGFRKCFFNSHWLFFCMIAFLPAFAFYGYRVFISGALQSQTGTQFIADLYWTKQYWLKWFNMMGSVTGYLPFFLGIFGLLVMPKGLAKSLCIGICGGYFLMGLVFNYAIHTHSYYQLIFLPWLGVCFCYGLLYCIKKISLLFIRYRKTSLLTVSGILLLLCGIIIPNAPAVKKAIDNHGRLTTVVGKVCCGHPKMEYMLFPDTTIIATAQELGTIVKHSQSVLFLSRYFAAPLGYHGYMRGINWPRGGQFYRRSFSFTDKQEMTPEEIYAILSKRMPPEYIVVTDFRIFSEQKGLQSFLETHFKKQAQTDQYIIYTPLN